MSAIRCATAQFQHRASDKAYNLAVIERFTEDAARREARIVAFPEMCVTGYWHVRNLDRVAIEALARIARHTSKAVEYAPTGPQWLHEIKLDGFRMAARIEHGRPQPRLERQISERNCRVDEPTRLSRCTVLR